MTPVHRRRRRTTLALAAATAILVPGLAQLPAIATDEPGAPGSSDHLDLRTLGDSPAGLSDLDLRGRVLPALAQRRAADALGRVELRWNDFGTPASILPADGVLARAASSDPVRAARAWLEDNAALFGLSRAAMADLELVNEQRLASSEARAVLFRQRFGDLTPALGSMVTVGVANGEIAYVSSSLVRTTAEPAAAVLSPLEGWLVAARNIGRTDLEVGDIVATASRGWTRLTVPGFAQEQQVRLRALALADGTVRPVLEANVVDVEGGSALAHTLMVDAVTGDVLHRQNQVDHSNDAFQYNGTITATDCGPKHPFELTDGNTKQIAATSYGAPTDDHVVKLFRPDGELLASGDLGTNPEYVLYAADRIPQGVYSVQVCPYDSPPVPAVLGPYAVVVLTSDTQLPQPGDVQPNPRWRYFAANPSLDFRTTTRAGGRTTGCWEAGSGCDRTFENIRSFGPWDTVGAGGVPSLTTLGNNASTREAWASPLTPGGLAQGPVSPTRSYTPEFTDAWNDARCGPQAFTTPTRNDIDAVVTNLFVNHNRMHDYSYYLGFTEENYNMQVDNGARGGVPGDPEIGNAQAGALTGGQPTTLGRDNANQITLQDGVPGITNQYLFQPLAGAFYSPCTDGGLDMSIVGHEYTHAISNRMVGGPDEGLTSEQGSAMGESWSDLVAAEYMFSHGYSTGTSPWVVGPYATGNEVSGIRDFPIDKNPLNYSDYGFDTTGDEYHADGEIWNGTMWEVRQALVSKYDRIRNWRFDYDNRARQRECAEAGPNQSPLAPTQCPGNRRWLQMMFDSFLLQQGATTFLDGRDAMLAANRMRFDGRDVKVMWDAFARRGMGKGASTPNADSGDVKPSFASPKARNGKVTFRTPGRGRLYVGAFEARVTPVADTLGGTRLDNRVALAPGRYRMLYVSPTHGFERFTLRVRPGQVQTVRVRTSRNLAAKASGAKVIGATAGSRNPVHLIDGTERTNWGGVTAANVDRSRPFVAVDLAGRSSTVRRVQVSAMLTPAPDTSDPIPLAQDEDPDSGSRFTALRKFALEACVRRCGSPRATWRRFYTSPEAAFPTMRPRPVAPNLIMRSFRVPATRAAAVRLRVLENQCTGNRAYAGEQDDDPLAETDCRTASDRGTIVHAAELQVFAR